MAGKASIFDVISPAFFSLLSSPNKETNFLLISKADQSFGKSITIDRRKLVDDLADFIRVMHISSVDEAYSEEEPETSEGQNPQTKANNFVRNLELKGWLDRDQDDDLNPIVQRTDAFITIYAAICELLENETNAKEFATPLLKLYRDLKNFDMANATASMQAVETDSKDLERALLSINSRIKRFVSKAMSDVNIGEKEILTKLTIDYQRLTAYVAFHNLMTRNNPNKYSAEIMAKLYELSEKTVIEDMAANYIVTKAIKDPSEQQIQEARDYFVNVLEDVEDQMNDIEASLNVIAGRNQAYVRSSSERIRFRLNNERNIKGEIGSILKKIKASGEACEEAIRIRSACFLSGNPTPNRFSRQRRLPELLQRRFPLSREKCRKKPEDGRKKSSVRKTHSPSKPSTPSYWALLAERNVFCFRKSRSRRWTDSSS